MFLTIKKIPKTNWSSPKPLNLKPKISTFLYLCLGLTFFGLGEGLLLVSYTGASPWSVLAQGISLNIDYSIGIITFFISLFVIFLWIFLDQKPGIGTILNAVIIALMIDTCLTYVETPEAFLSKILLAIVAVLLVGLGSGFYFDISGSSISYGGGGGGGSHNPAGNRGFGGIGGGCISLAGDGGLRQWQVHNIK